MDALSTPVPAKLSSRGGGGRPDPCRGRGSLPGSHTVPIRFRVVSALPESDLRGRLGSPGELGAATPSRTRPWVPGEFRPSSAAPMSRSGPLSVFVQVWLSDRQTRVAPCGRARRGPRASTVSTTPLGPRGVQAGPSLYSSRPTEPRLRVFTTRAAGWSPACFRHEAWSQGGENAESHHSASSRQQQTCRRSTAWREQASEGDDCLATGDRPGHRAAIRGKAGATVHDASRRAIRTAPNPGTSGGGALGATGGLRSARTASERDQGAGMDAESARDAVSRVAEGELGRSSEDAVRAARREVSTGTN